jgi:cytosine/adenosine deaminase-related metal-dependent hydrolase
MADLLIEHGIVVTMDGPRRVLDDGAVAVTGGRIVDVGPTGDVLRRHAAPRRIDGRRKIVMPGMIDGHAHAGHGLVKTLGGGNAEAWYKACETVYTVGSTEGFWRAEARLAALERLKCGTTTGVSFLGGGDSIMRTDEPRYGEAHCRAVAEVGIRSFLAVGPNRPPFPKRYARVENGRTIDLTVRFDDQIASCESLIERWHGKQDGRINICLAMPVHHPEEAMDAETLKEVKREAEAVIDLRRRTGVLFTQDGHKRGSIKAAHETFGLLGPHAFLSHSVDLTDEEIDICRTTDSRIVHNPSAIMSVRGRCPVPELLDAGVTVMLGSDGTAPDRGADMFRHMFQCMHYHRRHFRDADILPPGKVLEMVTIDAAKALGLESEIGSLEPGKRADIVLVDMAKPHLYPLNMPVYRLVCFANGHDVDTVIVDGKVLMEGRRVTTVDEAEVLDDAQAETEAMLDRTGLRPLLATPATFWGHSRY